MTEKYHYSTKLLGLGFPIASGREIKRADIVIFEKDRTNPYSIVEVKKTKQKERKEQIYL